MQYNQMNCGRDVGNGGDLGGKRKKYRQESTSSVVADPDNLLQNSKKARREAQGAQGLRTVRTSRKRVFLVALDQTFS